MRNVERGGVRAMAERHVQRTLLCGPFLLRTLLFAGHRAGGTILFLFQGAFSHSAHSANYYGDYPGNNPENHTTCGIMHNQFKTQKF